MLYSLQDDERLFDVSRLRVADALRWIAPRLIGERTVMQGEGQGVGALEAHMFEDFTSAALCALNIAIEIFQFNYIPHAI